MSILMAINFTVFLYLPIENLQEVRGLRGEHRQLCYRCAAMVDASTYKSSYMICNAPYL